MGIADGDLTDTSRYCDHSHFFACKKLILFFHSNGFVKSLIFFGASFVPSFFLAGYFLGGYYPVCILILSYANIIPPCIFEQLILFTDMPTMRIASSSDLRLLCARNKGAHEPCFGQGLAVGASTEPSWWPTAMQYAHGLSFPAPSHYTNNQ
jgi:hypothetical protein